MRNLITNTMMPTVARFFAGHLSERQMQWGWFVLLWFCGALSMVILGGIVKLIMAVHS